ncbi:MCP four helix bundle domain-containing protein [Olivibacter sp. SDN3]|uniref:MCP four helix bundle domain-containing protein n=1 Tax=Olivibacter sp. SDN3 TaxID=2764720 RepID=UPI0016514898|nr:MCP four helix bundle domain-containing protein [Olivibacter sp. SDN3]QNL47779.1 MCP four helix bundle domain-containing protein [Olivibacter sp. SDN3]
MKWTYYIRQKLKVAFLLFSIMACTILIRILEDKSVKSISNSLLTLYDDRLVPASDIYYIAEHLYAKKSLTVSFVNDTDTSFAKLAELKEELAYHDLGIDTLLNKYEKTYLVDQEQEYLNSFKMLLRNYENLEAKLIGAQDMRTLNEERASYHVRGRKALDQTIAKLSELEKLQTHVGREIMADAQFVVSGTRFFSTLQVILSIVIGVMVVVLVLASKSVIQRNKNEPFHLN